MSTERTQAEMFLELLQAHVDAEVAAALARARSVIDAEARYQWSRAEEHIPGAQIVAQRMELVSAVIAREPIRAQIPTSGADA